MLTLVPSEWVTGSKHCATRDQDVLQKCEPVNCVYKYEGERNFFDEIDQLCKKTPACFSDPASLLPKQVKINVAFSLENKEIIYFLFITSYLPYMSTHIGITMNTAESKLNKKSKDLWHIWFMIYQSISY